MTETPLPSTGPWGASWRHEPVLFLLTPPRSPEKEHLSVTAVPDSFSQPLQELLGALG